MGRHSEVEKDMNPKDKHADWLLKPTANKLADIQAFKTEELTIWERNTTATMLRQQQAEIEALKAGKIRAYDNGVEDGRKPDTNNKPVAWMETYKGEPNNLDWDKSNLNYGSEFHDVVPLYTHPVKELDEDFDAICLENKRLQAEIEKLRSWVEMLVEVPFFNEIDHYRGIPVSILRKASEK